ncbi:MAG: 6,7-dimethyl-8-ribityllumazine synthase [Magnetovibrionaceae bacterium]
MPVNRPILIVESPYYADISAELRAGAIEYLKEQGFDYEVIEVPGAFEIPGAIRCALKAMEIGATARKFPGFIALGCVIRGETSHYDYVCGESARGLMDLSLSHCAAIGYGILTVENREQAWVRADRKQKNKGRDAADACVSMIKLKNTLHLGGG